MTETSSASPAATDSWEGLLANLRRRYPGQKDSVLFCLHKLQQDPELSLRDFRDEAALHGIPTAGRALHSARLLLGLRTAVPKVAKAPAADHAADEPATNAGPGRRRRQRRPESDEGGSIETQVLDAVRQIQSAASQEADRLRKAVRQAIAILQAAVDAH